MDFTNARISGTVTNPRGPVVLGGENATTLLIEVWQRNGANDKRGLVESRLVTLDESGRVLFDELERNANGRNGINYQFRVAVVHHAGETNQVISQFVNINSATVNVNNQGRFAALRNVSGTGSAAANTISLTFAPSPLAEINRLATGVVDILATAAIPATGNGFITLGDYRIGMWDNSATLGDINRELLDAIESITITQHPTNGRLTVVIKFDLDKRNIQRNDRFSFGIQAVASGTANPVTPTDNASSNVARANVSVRAT